MTSSDVDSDSWEELLLCESQDSSKVENKDVKNAGWLVPRIEALFSQQRNSWPLFQQGEASLETIQTKTLLDVTTQNSSTEIIVQINTGRIASTHAKTDTKSIAARPCFLCPENMPPEERGIAFEELVILPNPFPVLPLHCTIPDRNTSPSTFGGGRVNRMLQLAQAVGPEMLVFYNGPKCGASAPDHFHFQACSAKEVPLFQEPFFSNLVSQQNCLNTRYTSFGRKMFVFANRDAHRVRANVEATLDAIETDSTHEEPMVNVLRVAQP